MKDKKEKGSNILYHFIITFMGVVILSVVTAVSGNANDAILTAASAFLLCDAVCECIETILNGYFNSTRAIASLCGIISGVIITLCVL